MEVLEVHIIFSSIVRSIQQLEADTYQVTFIDTTPMTFYLDSMTDLENEALFVKVQDYIIKSGRFT